MNRDGEDEKTRPEETERDLDIIERIRKRRQDEAFRARLRASLERSRRILHRLAD